MKPIFKQYDAAKVANKIQRTLTNELKIFQDPIAFDREECDANIILKLWYKEINFVTSTQCGVIFDVINTYARMYGDTNVWYMLVTIGIDNGKYTPCWEIRVSRR